MRSLQLVGDLAILATVCTWVTRLWCREKLGAPVRKIVHHRHGCARTRLGRWFWGNLSEESSFVHVPIIACVLTCNYRLIEGGPIGLFYATMFTAASAHVELLLLAMLVKAGHIEEEMDSAIKQGEKLLRGRVQGSVRSETRQED